MIGIVIPVYNRPEYFKELLDSLKRASFPEKTQIVFVDDCSTDLQIQALINDFDHPNVRKWVDTHKVKKGVCGALMTGFQALLDLNCDVFINLDSDSIVRNDFVDVLLQLHNKFPDKIVTGFNCLTKNKDGSERHRVLETGEGWNKKGSVGGLNMVFSRKSVELLMPILKECLLKGGNWDHKISLKMGGAYCTVPSVVQHIGLVSSMGHNHDTPDTADDFKPLSLPNVTLICVDTNPTRVQVPLRECTKYINFGAVKVISDVPIKSKEEYSKFCMKELYKHVDTEFMLVFQWDGYVKNWKAWDFNFLNYDYIGATWWYKDGMNVGNGGFSLRSRKLMEIVATDPHITQLHPEDDVICRKYRRFLEVKHGIKFAPEEVAQRFSIEGYRQAKTNWTNEFGFHGAAGKVDNPHGKICVIEQFFGIGDIIFSVQLAREFIKQGYKVLWPVNPEMVEGCNRAYPDILFMDITYCNVNMKNKQDVKLGSTRLIPIRWTYETMKVPFKDCMRSKYDFYGLDWTTWRNGMWERDEEKEDELFSALGLKEGEPYTLVNRQFRTGGTGRAYIPTAGKVVEMQILPEFSIFDWAKVIENATEIHTVSTSIIYLMEMLNLKSKKNHIYIRRPDEQNHDNYKYIMTRHQYIFEP